MRRWIYRVSAVSDYSSAYCHTKAEAEAFAEGDVVDIWNYESNSWDIGAVVNQVLTSPLALGGSCLEAGSILISYNGALRNGA